MNYRTSIKIILFSFIAFIVGCTQPAGQAGQSLLKLARRQFEQKHYVLTANTLSDFLRNEPKSREIAYAHYLRGLCYRQSGPTKYALARRDFRQAIHKATEKNIKRQAYIALGHIDFESNPPNYESAVKNYKNALPGLEDVPPKDAALYRLGESLQNIGQWEEADIYLSRCFNDFRQSPFAKSARQRFGSRTFRLQVGAFKNLKRAKELVANLRRKNWPADWTARRTSGKLLYIVRTGQYRTFAEARQGLSDLTRLYGDAMIVAAQLKN